MLDKAKDKKESQKNTKASRKSFVRQWILICLEQSGNTHLIPKEKHTTSADYLGDRKTYIKPTKKQ